MQAPIADAFKGAGLGFCGLRSASVPIWPREWRWLCATAEQLLPTLIVALIRSVVAPGITVMIANT
ncbi:hypothetical protein B0G77_2454 [Paraburkholderia sp. BL10I2N1]|nr:hypothetical protein B0G77_2454 [Paraburkholderia sp. BL10I2N1]